MSIDPTVIGTGAGSGGIIAGLLYLFGFKGRLYNIEEKVDAIPAG